MAALGALRMFGSMEIVAGAVAYPVTAPKLRTVLALLVIRRQSPVPVQTLVEEVWEQSPSRAVTTVQTYLYQLRRLLDEVGSAGRRWLVTTPAGYLADVDPDLVDVLHFEDLAHAGLTALGAGEPEVAAKRLRVALGLWRDSPLADVPQGPLLRRYTRRLTELYVQAREAWLDAEILCGRHRELLPELHRMSAGQPLHEGLSARLMVALLRSGRREDALYEYRRLCEALEEELGLAPSARLQRLARAVQRRQEFFDWRLRTDQRVDDEDCILALRAPNHATALVGRDGDVADLVDRLVPPTPSVQAPVGPRVVVLSGPPGAGKTALALEVARRVAGHFPDGQVIADLRDEHGRPRPVEQVLRRLCTALDSTALDTTAGQVPAGPTGPVSRGELAGTFRSLTAQRRLLLVLDHAATADQVRDLVPAGTGCAVIVTSTARLRGLPGITGHEVEPLALADSVRVLGRLLGERWVASDDDDAVTVVARLCDGLPLALSGAAALAQSRALGARDLVDLLADDSARLTLLYLSSPAVRGYMVQLWRGLDESVRHLWHRLARLDGNDAATALIDGTTSETDLELLFGRLLQASMLAPLKPSGSGPRFRLVDLARLYGRENPPVGAAAVAGAALPER